jgi:hypothetical protein
LANQRQEDDELCWNPFSFNRLKAADSLQLESPASLATNIAKGATLVRGVISVRAVLIFPIVVSAILTTDPRFFA